MVQPINSLLNILTTNNTITVKTKTQNSSFNVVPYGTYLDFIKIYAGVQFFDFLAKRDAILSDEVQSSTILLRLDFTLHRRLISDQKLPLLSFKIDSANRSCRIYNTRTISKRDWSRVDFEAFKQDLLSSMLLTNPPVNSDDLFICSDQCLRQVVDSHAPWETKVKGGRCSERWYTSECKEVKAETRRLERIYRSTHTAAAHTQWCQQFNIRRLVFQQIYDEYWRTVIDSCPDTHSMAESWGVFFIRFQRGSMNFRRIHSRSSSLARLMQYVLRQRALQRRQQLCKKYLRWMYFRMSPLMRFTP